MNYYTKFLFICIDCTGVDATFGVELDNTKEEDLRNIAVDGYQWLNLVLNYLQYRNLVFTSPETCPLKP
jgi:hypothetical protein